MNIDDVLAVGCQRSREPYVEVQPEGRCLVCGTRVTKASWCPTHRPAVDLLAKE